jgi:hypothetical protein
MTVITRQIPLTANPSQEIQKRITRQPACIRLRSRCEVLHGEVGRLENQPAANVSRSELVRDGFARESTWAARLLWVTALV